MTLDDLLKQNAAWLDQAVKRPVFPKVDEKAIGFPEEQRQRRIDELKARIAGLTRRKEEMTVAYDRAIQLEEQELKTLSAQKPDTPGPGTGADEIRPRPVVPR